jgi:hypothetical protein
MTETGLLGWSKLLVILYSMKKPHFLKSSRLKPLQYVGGLTIGLISTVGITAPANANTLAQSRAAAELFNFSHRPQAADAQTFRDAIAIGAPGQVSATAFSDAEFLSQNGAAAANNVSITRATGTGQNYSAAAESEATVTGFDFQVAAHQTFSFDWESSLFLNATSDRPTQERSSAAGLFGFAIYSRGADQTLNLIDTLDLFGRDDGTSNPLFDLKSTSGFQFTPTQTTNQFSLQGRYQRAVTQATQFTVFELKRNMVSVAAPEPSLAIAFIALGTTALLRKRWQPLA